MAHHRALRHFKSGQCKPGKPLAGVYLPFRLHVVKDCLTVSGIVDCVRREPDGDVHIRLRLARRYRRFLRRANAVQVCSGQKGKGGHSPHLVVEIIPQRGELPFPDNSADRAGFVTPRAPRRGEHITVTGPYVLDTNALHDLIFPGQQVKNWAEIHPAWNVTVRHAGGGSLHGRGTAGSAGLAGRDGTGATGRLRRRPAQRGPGRRSQRCAVFGAGRTCHARNAGRATGRHHRRHPDSACAARVLAGWRCACASAPAPWFCAAPGSPMPGKKRAPRPRAGRPGAGGVRLASPTVQSGESPPAQPEGLHLARALPLGWAYGRGA